MQAHCEQYVDNVKSQVNPYRHNLQAQTESCVVTFSSNNISSTPNYEFDHVWA